MMFKAIVTDKETKVKMFIESDCKNKTEFIKDLRKNGYKVNPMKVKTLEVFDYIMDNTDCHIWDWKENN